MVDRGLRRGEGAREDPEPVLRVGGDDLVALGVGEGAELVLGTPEEHQRGDQKAVEHEPGSHPAGTRATRGLVWSRS